MKKHRQGETMPNVDSSFLEHAVILLVQNLQSNDEPHFDTVDKII
jgi:hypothetical protein